MGFSNEFLLVPKFAHRSTRSQRFRTKLLKQSTRYHGLLSIGDFRHTFTGTKAWLSSPILFKSNHKTSFIAERISFFLQSHLKPHQNCIDDQRNFKSQHTNDRIKTYGTDTSHRKFGGVRHSSRQRRAPFQIFNL